MNNRYDAIIVGAGVAGIAAAIRLAEQGARILLLETRKKLGGRATSFTDVRTGETLDNCQHVALACCVNYLDLLKRLEVDNLLKWTSRLYWIEKGGKVSTLKPGLFPAPAHLTESFAAAHFLSLSEKTAIARAMLAILRKSAHVPRGVGTFSSWLETLRQPRSAIDSFWAPIVISACNLPCDRVDAAAALKVFREGFLANKGSSRMSLAAVPLVRLYDPAEERIRAAKGDIRLGLPAERITPRSVLTTDGQTFHARHVICAVPPERAAKLIDPALFKSDPRFAALSKFQHSPILGVHLTFDRPISDLPHAVLVNRPTQWLFNKSEPGEQVQRWHAVISAADDWMHLEEHQIAHRVLVDIHACIPESRSARLVNARPVKEKRATFADTPDIEPLRPDALGPAGASGLILAGDYTNTGWPATMEGAARSGYTAAASILGARAGLALVPELKPSFMVRALSPGARTKSAIPDGYRRESAHPARN